MSALIENLKKFGSCIEALECMLRKKQSVSLPDIYLDRIVVVNDEFHKLLEQMKQFLAGNVRNILVQQQELVLGGNALNTAKAMAQLGIPTIFIAETDPLGEMLLRSANYANLTLHLKVTHQGNYTTALEVLHEGVRKNIQLSYAPAISQFGPNKLEEQDWQAILTADTIVLSNWGANDKANELFRAILERVTKKEQIIFLDPADVFRRKHAILELVELLQDVRYLSLNEDEYAFINKKVGDNRDLTTLLNEGGRLNQHLPNTDIIVHTQEFVSIFSKDSALKIPTFDIHPSFQQGMGDMFNAGVIVGVLLEMRLEAAVLFGCATAGFYGLYGNLPSLERVYDFIQTETLRPASIT